MILKTPRPPSLPAGPWWLIREPVLPRAQSPFPRPATAALAIGDAERTAHMLRMHERISMSTLRNDGSGRDCPLEARRHVGRRLSTAFAAVQACPPALRRPSRITSCSSGFMNLGRSRVVRAKSSGKVWHQFSRALRASRVLPR